MITSVIDQYNQLVSLPGMKWAPQQRLVLASVLTGRTAEQMARFERIAEELQRQTSMFSPLKSMRLIIAAFLCRLETSPQEIARQFFQAYDMVKKQKIANYQPRYQAVVALLLILQERGAEIRPLPQRVERTGQAYAEWKKLHGFLTNQNLLPVLTLAAGTTADISRMVRDTEITYQQLLKMDLKKSMKTMQYAWLLTYHDSHAQTAGPAFLRYKELFKKSKVSGTTSAIQLLTLHGLAPETAVPAVVSRFERLKQEKSFRWLGGKLLLRIATMTYLREHKLQSLAEQAGQQLGQEDTQKDLGLIYDALDSVLIISILVATDAGSGGDVGVGGDCGSGDGGGGDGGC